MEKVISTESINCLGTKDINELEELLNEFNIQQYAINEIKEKILNA